MKRNPKAEPTGFTPGGEDADDDPQLQSLRAVWLAMPDEDPPESGMAALMAAARVKAEEMAKPSVWQRVMASLRRPPVLAFATVVVLVGGAALIGQRGDKMEAEPPSLRAEQDRTLEPGAPAVAPPAGAAQGSAMVADPAAAAEEKPIETGVVAEPAKAVKAENAPVNRRAAAPALKRDEPTLTTELKKSAPRPSPTGKAATANKAATRADDDTLQLEDGYDRGGEADKRAYESEIVVGGAAADSTAPAPPTAPAPTAPAPSKEEIRPRTSGTSASRASQYLAQAKSAASRGDCAAARVLMKRVASEDAAAYKKALASDAALNKCVAQ